jgi:hypothetical protein
VSEEAGHFSMAYIDQFFDVLIQAKASDLHIGEGEPPKIRIHGEITPIREEPITNEEAAFMMSEICGPKGWATFEERGDFDFAYEMNEESRFRCNFLKQTGGYGAVFRLIPTKIATLEQLKVPPVIKEFGNLRGGLVLVTGPTGSGKSTTLAALIDYINTSFSRHIITIEEPIEFVHSNKKSVITQREVPEHAASFPAGLKAALREDADIVLVGEMRDRRPDDRRLSRGSAVAGPHHAVLELARRGGAAFAQKAGWDRARGGQRDPGGQQCRQCHHPRGRHPKTRRRDRRRQGPGHAVHGRRDLACHAAGRGQSPRSVYESY